VVLPVSSRAEPAGALPLQEHDLGFVLGLAHRVVVLDFGRVIASGRPEAVGQDRAVRRAYLGNDAS
jgi:branched-chain amino acid transport system ATP-binding protein